MIALLTARPCALAKLHLQKRALKLCSATLRARAPMMRALVMCARQLTQANNIAQITAQAPVVRKPIKITRG